MPISSFNLFLCLALLNGVFNQGQDFKCGLDGSCIFGICDATRCASDDCGARQSNIQGDLLILDYNSLIYNAGPNKPPAVTNPASCCDKCKQTSGCNAWVFCSNKSGCGSGCQDYVDALADPGAGRSVRFQNGVPTPLPVLGFGNFGGCSGNKWPHLMCSLKSVPDINNPQEAGAEDGWVSGLIQTSEVCSEGPTFSVCNACVRSSDAVFCNQCASNVASNEQLKCAKCADLSTLDLQTYCTDCLKGGSQIGCGRCATFDSGIEECFQCTKNAADADTVNGCLSCQGKAPGCISSCVNIDATPSFAKLECGQCYSSSDTQRCVQCLQESQESRTQCSSCSTEECYSCLSKYPTSIEARQGCTNCESTVSDKSVQAECFECVNNPSIPDSAKLQCGFCSQNSDVLEKRQACYECLKTNDAPCSNCLRYAKDPDRCYECVRKMTARGSNAMGCYSCGGLDSPQDRIDCYACMEDEDIVVAVANTCKVCFAGPIDSASCTACYKTISTFGDRTICW